MRRFLAAIQFLTICPWLGGFRCTERELGRSAPFFPIVGLLIGGAVALLDCCMSRLLPPMPASVIAVVALIAASGGLHMDGLADTADGFLSARPRERIFEIMKDSHTGAMGVLAIVSVFCLKAAALASVPANLRFGVIVLMPVAGRCALVISMAVLPYTRAEGGLGTAFAANRSKGDGFVALGLLAAIGWLTAGMSGLAAGAISVAVALVFAHWCRRKIGGFTGDTLGAACELAELVPALAGAAWLCAR